MLARTENTLAQNPIMTAAILIAAVGAATIAGAWFFEYALKLAPCPLCLQQRWPYYLAVPLAAAVALGARLQFSRTALRAGLALVALAMLVGTALAVYHAGAEWKWWDGPQDCAGAGFSGGSAGDLMRRMGQTRVVRCDEAAWRDPVLRLSLAGWNALISFGLAGVAAAGIAKSRWRDARPEAYP